MALQHGIVLSFWLLNFVWRCVLLLWQVYDCMKPHDGVVVIRWSLVKILQKIASMDFLMASHGIATWNCVFFLAFEFGLTLCFVVMASLWLHEASWWCSRNPLISGEDTPKNSQHGFSDGKTWHCNMELCLSSGFWIWFVVAFLLLWQVYDCIKPHDGVVVIRWSLVKILQKLASMDFLMARHGIATRNCAFFLAFEFCLTLCFVVMASLWLHEASWWCSRNPLISGEDTPKISQHGFSDGKPWHCNMELCFLSGFWIWFDVVFCCYGKFMIAWSLMMV